MFKSILTPAYRWSDCGDGSFLLHRRYGFVAKVDADGRTVLDTDYARLVSKAASADQARRFVERKILAGYGEAARRSRRVKPLKHAPTISSAGQQTTGHHGLALLLAPRVPARPSPRPHRAAGNADAPEFEAIDWCRLLPDGDLPW